MLRVLFVCSGNTCRSPMAALLLQSMADKEKLPVQAQSAGLAAFSGDCASENAVAVMRELGLDLSAHRARPVSQYLLEESDLVVCMSEGHRRALAPFVESEKLLVPPGGVPDPFGGDLAAYRACRDALSAYIKTLLLSLAVPRIRPMTGEDVPSLAALEAQCFSVPWSENALRAELENEHAHFFVAELCGEICGYVGLHILLDEGYLCNLAVAEAFRRRGVGKALMSAAIDCCKAQGCAFLSLEVRPSNTAAVRLYEALGFSKRGERTHFYTLPDEDALILTLDF
ncbi:MAG: ribosomal protein S18-alanine N-acetyltransferase [Clostridia bacterium]|nr:ribosomal protein S18-alanine N-acetyltransferase [Clostridia bacterium]